MTVDAPGRL